MEISEIERLTLEHGQRWALTHVQRLLKLIGQIGTGLEYDVQAIQWAAYLHDWGAFPRYSQPGYEHARLSKQIAEREILPNTDLAEAARTVILEAIELHDYRDPRPVHSTEALLLREADFLDFLGMIGIAREFARGGRELQKSCQQIIARREQVRGRFTLPRAKRMAEARLARMDEFFRCLEEESFGWL